MKTLRHAPLLLAALLVTAAGAPPVYHQDPDGFAAATGERALVMGYADGLELWAYPFQLASDYRVRFRVAGSVAPIDGNTLLRRVERRADEVVRIYVGPDFVVRERLFVPRQRAGVIIRYEVEGVPKIEIEASFVPVLDLMWPGAVGGQNAGWDEARRGYLLREPLGRFAATIASPEAAAHDMTINSTRVRGGRLHIVLVPRDGIANVYAALDPDAATDGTVALRGAETAARADAAAWTGQLLDNSLQVETPDPAINRALTSAALTLDQAWACNDQLGCGVLAGFGPSRPGRRPQYAWFFAGDGLVAMEGMLAAGQYERARAELAFVTRWQDPKTGMLWHELSQSAGLIDWSRYPSMYVHVDITLQYLAAVARYVAISGETDFAKANWRALAHAWRYAGTLVDPVTSLPRIPPGRQGQNEQDDLGDDLGLSRAYVAAAEGYADLAQAVGRADVATSARAVADRTRASAAAAAWDEARGFPISGHRRDGSTVPDARAGGALGVVASGMLTPEREARVLDRIAGPDFVTDWGLRSLAASDPRYNPNLYSSGSVWGLGTAEAAATYWRAHRPLTAWALWQGLAAWNTLDSAGHMHEVLAGDFYHPEVESVPEQTWSSAGFLRAGVEAMLGLEPRPARNTLGFAPHLPADWGEVTVRNVRVGTARLTVRFTRDIAVLTLAVENSGAPLAIDFAPELPLGAMPTAATVNDRPAEVALETHAHDSHARLRFTAATGTTTVRVVTTGGVMVAARATAPELGQRSRNPMLVDARLDGDLLILDGWVADPAAADVIITTARGVQAVEGAAVSLGDCRWEVALASTGKPSTGGYAPARAALRLGAR